MAADGQPNGRQGAEADQELTYNVKAVVQATGVTPDTLRAWERRYGLPNPGRSEGKHRLYCQSDVDLIRWLVARQSEGVTISRAVDQWRKLSARDEPTRFTPTLATATPSTLSSDLSATQASWLDACFEFDEARAESILARALALHAPEQVCFDVLLSGLGRLGEAWARGEITVQHEHFASEMAMRRVSVLIGAAPSPYRAETLIVACSAGERHAFPTLLLTLLLRNRGLRVVHLGADVPIERLDATVAQLKPALVVLVAQLLTSAATLSEAARFLGLLGVPVVYGGRVFVGRPSLRGRVAGTYLGDGLASASIEVDRALQRPSVVPALPLPEGYATAADLFRRHEPMIALRAAEILASGAARLSDRLPDRLVQSAAQEAGARIALSSVGVASAHLGQQVTAALALGDLGLIETQIEWLASMLGSRAIRSDSIAAYIRAYSQAAGQILGSSNPTLTDWLARLADRWPTREASDPSSDAD